MCIRDRFNRYEIDLMAIAGQKILTNLTTSTNQARLDLSHLKSGLYFLNIRDEEGNSTIVKFVKVD